ncbi:Mitochondrial sodium/calcium exchanger protein [Balamuthia mandrillaris]
MTPAMITTGQGLHHKGDPALRFFIKYGVLFVVLVAFASFSLHQQMTQVEEEQGGLMQRRDDAFLRALLNNNSSSSNSSSSSSGGEISCADLHSSAYHSPEAACEFVMEYCPPDGFLNYLRLNYCMFKGRSYYTGMVLALWILFLFYVLGNTAEGFFCPTLACISTGLNLAPDVAGVTILAFGNGAPDLFATYAAVAGDSFNIAVGELIGGGVFVTCCVTGACALAAKVTLKKLPFVRDICFYLIGSVAVFAICADGNVYLWESICLVGLYLCYVSFVIGVHLRNVVTAKRSKRNRSISINEVESHRLLTTGGEELAKILNEDEDYPCVYASKTGIYAQVSLNTEVVDETRVPLLWSGEECFRPEDEKASEVTSPESTEQSCCNLKSYWMSFVKDIGWREMNIMQRIYFFLSSPVVIITSLCIPLLEEENWKYRRWAILACPLFSSFLILTIVHDDLPFSWWVGPVPLLAVVEAGAFLLTIFLYLLLPAKAPPTSRWRYFMVCWAFCASVGIIYITAGEVVSVLDALGRVWNISHAILGITVLAWGNSIGDLVSDVVVARNGFPGMAVAACFGGPFFNLLVGLGVALTVDGIRHFGREYTVDLPNQMIASFAFLWGDLVSTLLVVCFITKFTINKKYGCFLLFFYLCFMATAVGLEIQHIVG